ncbi:MAG: chloramphenicol phosphotransferase CPT family protein [Ruegeria sp.]
MIFLHGASSSGKTTLAQALQKRIEIPFWHVSIDHLRDSGMLPMNRFHDGAFDWRQERERIFDGFHRSVGAYADAGNNLILEHILDTPGWASVLRQQFARHDVFFVAVHCALPVLTERERRRADRPIGSAERDKRSIHKTRVYDLELNSEDGLDANIEMLLDAWRSGRRRSEFS